MGSLRLVVESASSSFSVWQAGSDYKTNAGDDSAIIFSVSLGDHDQLELKTGEIFRKKSYHKLHSTSDKAILATLTFRAKQPESERKSQLHYLGSIESKDGLDERYDSRLIFEYVLDQCHFDQLKTYILAGAYPKQVSLEFPDDAFTFGWEPDGSHQIWDNVANRRVDITGCEFRFNHFGDDDDEADLVDIGHFPDDRKSFSDTARVSYAVIEKLSSLEKKTTNLLWGLGILLVIVIFELQRR